MKYFAEDWEDGYYRSDEEEIERIKALLLRELMARKDTLSNLKKLEHTGKDMYKDMHKVLTSLDNEYNKYEKYKEYKTYPYADEPFSERPGTTTEEVPFAQTLQTAMEELRQEMAAKIADLTAEEEQEGMNPVQSARLLQMAEIILLEAAKQLRDSNSSEKNIAGWNLSGQNLSSQDFTGWDMRETNLQDSDLRRAELAGACLEYANMRGAVLNGANLCGALLEGADLRETWWQGAELEATDFLNADLFLADLRHTDLRWARQLTVEQLAKAIIDETTKFPAGITLEDIQKAKEAMQTNGQAGPNPSYFRSFAPF
jgi:hypothetical protein